MFKKLFLWSLFILHAHSSVLHGVAPETPRKLAFNIALVGSLEGPIVWAILEGLNYGRFTRTIQDPKVWRNSVIASVGCGVLAYLISNQYTPQNKFKWASKIKRTLESDPIFMVRDKSGNEIKEAIQKRNAYTSYYSFSYAIRHLHKEFLVLEKAYEAALEAPADIPHDDVFKRKCDSLAYELRTMLMQMEELVIRIISTQQWFEEITGKSPEEFYKSFGSFTMFPQELNDSFRWAIGLTSVLSLNEPSRNYGQVTFRNAFIDSLDDWNENKEPLHCEHA